MSSALIETFEKLGGEFVSPPVLFMQKWNRIKAFVFDWDGVFNTGIKGHKTTSHFTEADSMGVNMLRFSHWLNHRKTLPATAIITGQNNLSARHFADREHFDFVFTGCPDKREAFGHFLAKTGLEATQVMFVFDDILDLTIASKSGLSLMTRRKSSPLFYRFVKDNEMTDYISAHSGGENAVREICELMIGLNGNYNDVVQKRMVFDGDYAEYLAARNGRQTVHSDCK